MLSLNRIVEDEQFPRSWPTETLMGPQEGNSNWSSHSPEAIGFEADNRQMDEMFARYVGEVRQFAMLSPAQERELWQRVMYWQTRLRRALYLSPVALPTLITLWRQVQRGDVSRQHLLQWTQPASHPSNWDMDQLEARVYRLRALSTCLRRLSSQRRRGIDSPHEQRAMRGRCRQLWREWLTLWNDIPFAPEVHDTMFQALQAAIRKRPECPALRVAHRAATRAQRELAQAKTQMIVANLRLVIYMAKRHYSTHLSFLDLIQEGNAGLMRALERFDPQRGVKFATYACWWIRQSISRAVVNQNEIIRVPNHVVERKNKLRKTIATLHQRYQRPPTDRELSAALSWPLHVVEQTRQEHHVIGWLHDSADDDNFRFDDIVQDDQVSRPDEDIARLQLQQCVVNSLDTLPKRDAQVLRLRFGLETDRAYTLQEIGEQMGLSRERIRQIEKAALEKLRLSAAGASLAEAAGIAAS